MSTFMSSTPRRAHVSKEAVAWAMDDAPMLLTEKGKPDTTARHVLQVLAEHAHANGGGARPSVMRIQHRTGYERSTVQRALRRLEQAGLIFAESVINGCTVYRLALNLKRGASDWDALEAEENLRRKATADRVRKHRAKHVTHLNDVTDTHSDDVTSAEVTHSDGVTDGDVTHFDDACNAVQQRSVTHSVRPEPTTYEPTTEPKEKDSCSPPPAESECDDALFAVAAPPVAAAPPKPVDTFDAWWSKYPRKAAKGHARLAYASALKKPGITPELLLAAVVAYSAHHVTCGTAKNWIAHPTTWLNGERWDDELVVPEQRGNGSPAPFRNPVNQDDYDGEL